MTSGVLSLVQKGERV